jgi:hypothetical protein
MSASAGAVDAAGAAAGAAAVAIDARDARTLASAMIPSDESAGVWISEMTVIKQSSLAASVVSETYASKTQKNKKKNYEIVSKNVTIKII